MIRLLYVYIVCFTFGALYSLISAVLGARHSGGGEGGPADADGGNVSDITGHSGIEAGHGLDAGHVGHGLDAGHAGHGLDAGVADVSGGDTGHTFTDSHAQIHMHNGGADGNASGHVGDAADGNTDGTYDSTGEKVNPSPFNTTVIFSSVAAFGGVGLIGKLGFSMSDPASALLAFVCSAIVGAVIFFGVVKLIYNSQSNTMFSGRELIGAEAEVNIPIPAKGLGVIVCVIRGTRHTLSAKSRNGTKIGQGEKVRIREISSNVALVSRKIAADEFDFDKMRETRKGEGSKYKARQ